MTEIDSANTVQTRLPRVVVTGAAGFIGWHTQVRLRALRYLSSQVRQFDGQVFCSSGWGWLIQDCSGIRGGTGRRPNRSGCAA
jgi:hypothetical protein